MIDSLNKEYESKLEFLESSSEYTRQSYNELSRDYNDTQEVILNLNKKIARRKRRLPYVIGASILSGFILNNLTK